MASSGDPLPEDASTEAHVAAIHEHLAATATRPVERSASRWIGEAEAVAADLVDADLPEAVVVERLGHVRRLLSKVEDPGDLEAADHVDRAAALVERVLSRLDDS